MPYNDGIEVICLSVIMSKYEYLVMRCAVQQKGSFDAKGLYHALCNAGITKLSESGAVIILNRLAKKTADSETVCKRAVLDQAFLSDVL